MCKVIGIGGYCHFFIYLACLIINKLEHDSLLYYSLIDKKMK